ncbi:MAG TPA: hypothetical protein VHM92_05895 [Allosphingosinicella sp.]|nr:hypothetical protein [Allosphingosinicella sp.]
MARINPLLAAAALAAALSPVAACPPKAVQDPAVAQREHETNAALLAALLQRRSEVVAGRATPESKSYALKFLDSRIAEVRSRMGR